MLVPLFILIFGIIEFGLIITDQQTLTHAAADAARVGARGDSPTNQSAAAQQANNYLGDLRQCSAPSVVINYDRLIPDYIHVTVSCTYQPLTPLGSFIALIGGSFNATPKLSATSSMRVQ